KRGPNKLERAKLAEIERCRVEGIERIGTLSEREFLMAGLGLYAGDGAKAGRDVKFANSNPDLIRLFCCWLRAFFAPDESRLRSSVTGIPVGQFIRPYRAPADPTRRTAKHIYGCCHVTYSSAPPHRAIMGMLSALALVQYESDPG
ncbi:MAG: hypothetical protein AAGC53_17845, partial [Actinomycetota bacterium]